MSLRCRLVALLAVSIVASVAGRSARGAGRDTAFYPVSAHELSEFTAPPLVFEKVFEATVPGAPAHDPLEAPASEGEPVVVRTSEGDFLIDAGTGEVRESRPSSSPPSSAPPLVLSCEVPGGAPHWLRHLHFGASGFTCLAGPGGILAIVGRDGTLFGRELRGGHLFWRRTAAHRVSRAPLSVGPYLVVAPDASRELQALRWSDGSPAGVFRLDSEDAYFVSAPLASGERIYVLAVDSPRPETRLIALVPRQAIGVPRPATPVRPSSPSAAPRP